MLRFFFQFSYVGRSIYCLVGCWFMFSHSLVKISSPSPLCVSGYIAKLYVPRSVLGRRHRLSVCLPHLYLAAQFPHFQYKTCFSIVVVRVTIVQQYVQYNNKQYNSTYGTTIRQYNSTYSTIQQYVQYNNKQCNSAYSTRIRLYNSTYRTMQQYVQYNNKQYNSTYSTTIRLYNTTLRTVQKYIQYNNSTVQHYIQYNTTVRTVQQYIQYNSTTACSTKIQQYIQCNATVQQYISTTIRQYIQYNNTIVHTVQHYIQYNNTIRLYNTTVHTV
jgi:hypothetical protein